jgi:hypothetical protein
MQVRSGIIRHTIEASQGVVEPGSIGVRLALADIYRDTGLV